MQSFSRPRTTLADVAESRSIKDVLKALQATFSSARLPLSLPTETRRMLQTFIEDQEEGVTEEDSARVHSELKNFWERNVGDAPAKTGAFVGVLRELRPLILGEAAIYEWWQLVVRSVVGGTGYRKTAQDDAQVFVIECMAQGSESDSHHRQGKTSKRLLTDLLGIYVTRTRPIAEDDPFIAPENMLVARQVEDVLTGFGRKHPKDLFHGLDDLVIAAETRLQALTLLTSFLRNATPHIYLVINTRLVEHLLKCLMNDTSTIVLSVALTALIMLLPHIPGSLKPFLPRLFLVYSRVLCWEKFSSLSTEAQRSFVTDDRTEVDHGDVGIDPGWEKARPKDAVTESATPELLTYFTYLYGMYPLNFMSYIRKPRRYLKNIDFPGAADFDLDQEVIRARTEQYRQVHLLHPNFYNSTIEEELIDVKWPKSDPADVAAECHALCVNAKPALFSPGPPPSGRLPDVPPMPPLNTAHLLKTSQLSPSPSSASFRSRRISMTSPVSDGDSPVLHPLDLHEKESTPASLRLRSKASSNLPRASPSIDDFPMPGSHNSSARSSKDKKDLQPTNLAFLQRENTLIRNELNFERWHKAQYSQHISQLMRKNVKDATAEAETLNLINTNRALKMQLEQVRTARESTIKDSQLTRKQANSLETNLSERFKEMRKEQVQWQGDAEELRRLRTETKQYRELLVAAEARELNKSHQLEIVKRDLESMRDLQAQLQVAERRVREFEYREFEFDQAKREQEILMSEKETLMLRVARHQQDQARARQVYANKIMDLESQLGSSSPSDMSVRPPTQRSPETQMLVQQAVAESNAKLTGLKKAHTRLLERYTDLELEYQTVKAQLEDSAAGDRGSDGYHFRTRDYQGNASGGGGDSAYDTLSDYVPESSYIAPSTSEPTSDRRMAYPLSPPRSEATIRSGVGLTWQPHRPLERQASMASRSTGQAPYTFNQTAPLGTDEVAGSVRSGLSGAGSETSSALQRKKITPDSTVRVYGRGGAQNIKLKEKDKNKNQGTGEKEKKSGVLKGLRGLV